MSTTANAPTATVVPTRFDRAENRSHSVATFAQADGCVIHCAPGDEALAVTAARAKALAFGLTPYVPKGKAEPAAPKTLGPSRRIPGYVALTLNFTRPDHAQTLTLASAAQ